MEFLAPIASCATCGAKARCTFADAFGRLQQGRAYRKQCACGGVMVMGASEAAAWASREAKLRAAVPEHDLDRIAASSDATALAALAVRGRCSESLSAPPTLPARPRPPKVVAIGGCFAVALRAPGEAEAVPMLTNGCYASGARDFNRFDAVPSECAIVVTLPGPIELCAVKIAAGNAEDGGAEAIQSFELHVAYGAAAPSDVLALRWERLLPRRTYRSFGDTMRMTQRPQLFPTAPPAAPCAAPAAATTPHRALRGIRGVVAVKLVVLSTHGAARYVLRQIGVRGRRAAP